MLVVVILVVVILVVDVELDCCVVCMLPISDRTFSSEYGRIVGGQLRATVRE